MEARTALPLCGSTVSPAKITAPAPAASATRATVPALPGSETPTRIATSGGVALSALSSGWSSRSHTATMPCGVTVSESTAAAFSFISEMRSRAWSARTSRSPLRAPA